MANTRSLTGRIAWVAALSAIAGSAFAQTPSPKPGPMPTELPTLGDKDAVCFLGSAMAAARVQAEINNAPAEIREGTIELSWRQMAFYIGKVSAKSPEPQASDQVTTASRNFTTGGDKQDRRPIMQWCLRTYLEDAAAFQTRLDGARKLAVSSPANLAAIKVDTLDEDALCFALVGIALPQTMKAAKTDPKAAAGVRSLGRSQHFYMGRLLTKPLKGSIEQAIADAWNYTAVLNRANDNATAHAKVTSCVVRFDQTFPSFFRAAEKGLPAKS